MEYQAPSSDSDRSISENGRIFYRPRITTNDLPADVLVIILEEAFCAVRELYTKREAGRPDPIQLNSWPTFEDCIPEYPFAESLASVASIWREAMSSVSTFWTPLVIWLGRDSTPISRIRQYLSWSRKQPLEIYVLRRYDPAIAYHTEKERVAAIVELLLPHVQRWKVLCLTLLYASSLPRPRFELLGCADNLVRLNLDFIIDDTVGSTMTTAPVPGVFKTPMVHELSMHGRHFLESYMGPYPSYVVPPKLARLALTNYARAPRNNSRTVEFFSLLSLVECLVARPDLRLLHLENLELDCVCYVWPGRLTPTQHRWNANVKFVDMCGDIIAEYYYLLRDSYVDHTAYTRRTLPDRLYPARTHPVGESSNTRIAGIACPLTLMHYLINVEEGGYCDVTIEDCDGFCTKAVRLLAEPVSVDNWLCPNVTGLTVVGCTKFSSGDLRAALEARWKVHAAAGFPEEFDAGHVVSSVWQLRVRNCCELAAEDKEWFDKRVAYVRWE